MNSFALYSRDQKIKDLENARKKIDELYTTRKDSAVYKNNLGRALIYSTLALVDVNRKYNYKKDPVEETIYSLSKLNNSKHSLTYKPELDYIKNQLLRTYLFRANKALQEERYDEALTGFMLVDSLSGGENVNLLHNLALLNERSGNKIDAINYYNKVISKDSSDPSYFLALANLYEERSDYNNMLITLQKGYNKFPHKIDLIFKLLNTYSDKSDFSSVISLLQNGLVIDNNDFSLNYLAGFAYEITGNKAKAEYYYKMILENSPDNYEANYALGLLYLNSFLINTKNNDPMFHAKRHLIKAYEINPNDLKSLQSLSILYSKTGDVKQLEKVNNKLNELILN